MRAYRSIFHDKNLNNLVSVDLEIEDMVVDVEGEEGRESQAVEFDVKNGYNYGYGFNTPAYIETPLLYEYSIAGDLEESMDSDARIIDRWSDRSRNVRGAFDMLFKNYILTTTPDEGLSRRGQGRFWYSLSGGGITTYRKVNRGLNIRQKLLKRDGQGLEESYGNSVLPNIWGGGDTCHGGLADLNEWRESQGKSGGDPDVLYKSYELFKSGVGNTDLLGHNESRDISNGTMEGILTEFQDNYVNNLQDGVKKRKLTGYIDTYKRGLHDRGLTSTNEYNLNNLAGILDKTESYYIEDFL